jgi:hypothetical protein
VKLGALLGDITSCLLQNNQREIYQPRKISYEEMILQNQIKC